MDETKSKPANRGYWSPLGILAAALGLVDASFVAAGSLGHFDTYQRWSVIGFAALFALLCLGTLYYLVTRWTEVIYPPWVFRTDEGWHRAIQANKDSNRAQIEWFDQHSTDDTEELPTAAEEHGDLRPIRNLVMSRDPDGFPRALRTIRAQIEIYAVLHRQYPHFARCGWQEMLDDEYFAEAPRNPHSPEEVAAKILVSNKPSMTGMHANPMEAGWVWNRPRQSMFAAGTAD